MSLRPAVRSRLLPAAFVLCQLALGLAVQHTGGPLHTTVSYAAVALCFLYVLLWLDRTPATLTLLGGLLFTLVADLFLVVLRPTQPLPAMVCFSVTQLLYCTHICLYQRDAKARSIHLAIRAAASLAGLGLAVVVLGDKTDPLSLVSVFYYANLLCSIGASLCQGRRCLLFSLGLVLFALCDLFVGLTVLADSYLTLAPGSLLYRLAYPGFNAAWLFYVPSQTLIALYTARQGRRLANARRQVAQKIKF